MSHECAMIAEQTTGEGLLHQIPDDANIRLRVGARDIGFEGAMSFRAFLHNNEVPQDAMYWHAGMETWAPVGELTKKEETKSEDHDAAVQKLFRQVVRGARKSLINSIYLYVMALAMLAFGNRELYLVFYWAFLVVAYIGINRLIECLNLSRMMCLIMLLIPIANIVFLAYLLSVTKLATAGKLQQRRV